MNEQEFLADVTKHEMKVLRSEGLYRHIRFKQPGNSCYWFDLVTIPGKLIYTGDMGTFVFSRLDDMFVFFRSDREYAHSKGRQLGINPGYWAEKLLAVDGNRKGSFEEFDPEAFTRVINEYRIGWMRNAHSNGSLSKDERRTLWEDVDDEILSRVDECGEDVMRLAYEFSWRNGERNTQRQFNDLFDHRFTRHTRTFLWCCYAIAWGIQTFDKAAATTTAAAEPRSA